jgi:hypothetical protein
MQCSVALSYVLESGHELLGTDSECHYAFNMKNDPNLRRADLGSARHAAVPMAPGTLMVVKMNGGAGFEWVAPHRCFYEFVRV